MPAAAAILAGILPMLFYAWLLYHLDRYEKEPIPLLATAFSWGMVVAAGGAFLINSLSSLGIYLLTGSELATQVTISTLVAPLVEETLKGAAVLLIYLLYRPDFDSALDGLIYAGIAALGFAATENIWYIYQLGYLPGGWQGLLDLTAIRVLIVGWQHPFYTAFTGLGFALARRSKRTSWRFLAPFAGWAAAVALHLTHNLMAILLGGSEAMVLATIWDWSGYLGLLILIAFLIRREQRWMKDYLKPEQEAGILTPAAYQVACSAWGQSREFLKARLLGSYRETRLLYQYCGDLMHKKHQLARHGEEEGNSLEIDRLRQEISRLSRSLAEI